MIILIHAVIILCILYSFVRVGTLYVLRVITSFRINGVCVRAYARFISINYVHVR